METLSSKDSLASRAAAPAETPPEFMLRVGRLQSDILMIPELSEEQKRAVRNLFLSNGISSDMPPSTGRVVSAQIHTKHAKNAGEGSQALEEVPGANSPDYPGKRELLE